MKKILITGAFGFVGSNLSAYLADRGYELWALDVERGGSSKVEEATAEAQSVYERCYTWEQLEEIAWDEVDAVVHLAGKAHDTRNTGDPQSYFDVNVGLTQRVLEMFSRQGAKAQREDGRKCDGVGEVRECGSGVRKFVLFSSVKAVADSVEGVLVEEAVPQPQTAYGQSKLEAEGVVGSFSRKGAKAQRGEQPEVAGGPEVLHLGLHPPWHAVLKRRRLSGCKLRTYTLRSCMIHGPGNKGNLNLLYKVVRSGVPWPLGAFENQRSFASIENVCAVVEGLISGDVEGGIFQVADDEALSTNKLIELIAESQDKLPRLWRISPRLVAWMARVGDVLHLPLNRERLKKLTESYVVSNVKIKKALGWERMPVGAEEGMERTLESFSRKGAKAQRLRVEEG